jgi:hypothetical protein
MVTLAASGAVGAERGAFVTELDAQRQRAMAAADSAALDTLLAERCVYTHSTGLVQTKREVIAMLTSGDVDYVSFDVDEIAAEVYQSTVVVTGKQTIELVVRGKPVTSRSRYTAVWVRTGAAWRCVAYQSTPAAPPEGGKE